MKSCLRVVLHVSCIVFQVKTVSELSDSSRQSYTAVNRHVDSNDRMWLYSALKDSASLCGRFLSYITNCYQQTDVNNSVAEELSNSHSPRWMLGTFVLVHAFRGSTLRHVVVWLTTTFPDINFR